MSHNFPYVCQLCKNFLEEENFTYAIDKRTGNPVLFCNPCRKDGEEFRDGKITEEELKRLQQISKPPKIHKILKINNLDDIIYFEKETDNYFSNNYASKILNNNTLIIQKNKLGKSR